MAESTLNLKFEDLCGSVGLFLGFGRGLQKGDPAWSAYQQAAVEECVRSGLRQFYFPPPVEGTDSAYDWSFLKPYATLTLAQGESEVDLPGDFGGLEGEVTLATGTSQVLPAVRLANPGMIKQAFAEQPGTTGRPLMAALQPLRLPSPDTGEVEDPDLVGQRWQLAVFPTADREYTLQLQYYVLADALTGDAPYAYGGMAHAETILESCLAIAEQRLDDASTVHSLKFKERLLASISLDRRHKAQNLGYCGDNSDAVALGRERPIWNQAVTYRGTAY